MGASGRTSEGHEAETPRRYDVPRDVVARRFPTEMVLLNVGTGQYHGLNGSAADLFELLRDHGSPQEVAVLYAVRCAQPVERIAEDLERLIEDLVGRELLTRRT